MNFNHLKNGRLYLPILNWDVCFLIIYRNFIVPDSSVGKESVCNARDPGLISGSGRYAGEGLGYPLQYSWASLVAQLEKNLPAMQKTWVKSLVWEDPLEKGTATHSSIVAWRTVHGVTKSQTQLSDFRFTVFITTLVLSRGNRHKQIHTVWCHLSGKNRQTQLLIAAYISSEHFFLGKKVVFINQDSWWAPEEGKKGFMTRESHTRDFLGTKNTGFLNQAFPLRHSLYNCSLLCLYVFYIIFCMHGSHF